MRQSRVQSVSRLLWKGERNACHTPSTTMVKREKTKISVEGVNFKQPTEGLSIKKSGAWRYPGGIIQRAPSKMLGSKEYTDDKDEGEARRKHESNFFITLNTNRSLKSATGLEAEIGKEACKRTLDDLSEVKWLCVYTKFGPKSDHYKDDVFDDVINKVEWQAAVEVGEQLQRLHCHIWLTLHHYSQVQVNMPVMQRLFQRLYNGHIDQLLESYPPSTRVDIKAKIQSNKNPYIQVKLLPSSDWALVIKQYIHKGMAAA